MENKNDKKDDVMIREFAESVKELKTPEDLRDSNRRHIRKALCSVRAERGGPPGWLGKRISVPFPVAAGFLLIFCLQLALQLFRTGVQPGTSEPPVTNKTDSIGLLEKPVEPRYSESNVYVAGMGFVENVKDYAYVKDRNHEKN